MKQRSIVVNSLRLLRRSRPGWTSESVRVPRRRRRHAGEAEARLSRRRRAAVPLTFKTKLQKALIARPTEDELKRMKDAGFEA